MTGKTTLFRPLMLVASLLLLSSVIFTACKKDDPQPTTPVLAITSIQPGSAPVGQSVTIFGTGFSTTPSANSVTFGSTPATVVSANANGLVVTVPNVPVGNVTVSVAQSGATTVTTPFTVAAPTGKPVITVTGSITANQTWDAGSIYLLNGFVYVRSGATVTIPAGTVIKGDKLSKGTLIFEPGSKIIAQGTATNPIVFTSNLAPGLRNLGDWGGLVIAGKGLNNLATGVTDGTKLPKVEGGPDTFVSAIEGQRDAADNSGVLSYVRIEWAGVALSPNNEINGLSLYAVGSGTKIDHVQVSYANDDSFEWFGGNVNMNYLIAYRGIDDDFDTDNGFSGNVQFGLSVRDLTIADQSGSKGFESDNDANGTLNLAPQTAVVFSNMTLTGPTAVSLNATGTAYVQVASAGSNPSAAAPSANYVAAMHIRRNSALSVFNSVAFGWPAGILLDGTNVANNVAAGRSVIANNIIGGNLTGAVNGVANSNRDILYISGTGGAGSLTPINALGPDSTAFGTAVGPVTYLRVNNNRRLLTTAAFLFTNPFAYDPLANSTKPDVTPATGSPALTGAAFTNAKLAATFFDKTPTYVGAVGAATNYTTEAWVNFSPQFAVYQ